MKKAPMSGKPVKKENGLISRFSEKEILSLQTMSFVRGGISDGSDPIIIIPPPPRP